MKVVTTLLFLSMMCQDNPACLFDFKNEKNTAHWTVVNDGVMGGLSQAEISINDAENGLFKGYVTTANNGGFASVRYGLQKKEVSQFKQLILEVKGDGKTYQFRIKDKSSQRFWYITTFKTSGAWERIVLPFDEFYPSFRGNALDQPNYSGKIMEDVAILIGNKRNESFALEIKNILLE